MTKKDKKDKNKIQETEEILKKVEDAPEGIQDDKEKKTKDEECKCGGECKCDEKGECGDDCKCEKECEECECDEGSEDKVKSLEEQVKRALADYQNLEKRVAQERHEWIKTANKDLILRLLPILDTLLLAQVHEKSKTLEVTINQFLDALKVEGVEQIKTIGEKFDPYTMEVIETREGDEDKIIDEVRAGYRLYDKIIRPAQVIVGKQSS